MTVSASHSHQTVFHLDSLKSDWSRQRGFLQKKKRKKEKQPERCERRRRGGGWWWNEWWNRRGFNQSLSTPALRGNSSPHQPSVSSPTGRRATSQSALLRGLFNNVEEERRDTKWERKRFPGAVGAPSVTFTSGKTLDVCVRVWWPCATLMIPPSGTLTRGTKLSWKWCHTCPLDSHQREGRRVGEIISVKKDCKVFEREILPPQCGGEEQWRRGKRRGRWMEGALFVGRWQRRSPSDHPV